MTPTTVLDRVLAHVRRPPRQTAPGAASPPSVPVSAPVQSCVTDAAPAGRTHERDAAIRLAIERLVERGAR